MFKVIYIAVFTSLISLNSFADNYVECRCSVNFKTSSDEVISVSDYVYCPSSEDNNFSCYGDVIGNSLDTICENSKGEVSKSPNWSAPRNSTEIPNTLSCSL